MSEERHTSTEQVDLISDPEEKARREAENGIRQTELALEMIRAFVKEKEQPFRLRQGFLMQLHSVALEGIHMFAGTYRNGVATIHGSKHDPVPAFRVADEVADMCEYVNQYWADKSAIHLAAYILWRLNWIHPFADGNGRTARAISYVVLSIRANSLYPGTNSIPDQISTDKNPYYDALELADEAWKATGQVDVSALEKMLSQMLATQLLQGLKEAETVQPAE
ncbi:MAG TPA: Fic family protein [Bradyrhizobium sp.]|nr:Fic family protein [Bradyrhizobium sp.]